MGRLLTSILLFTSISVFSQNFDHELILSKDTVKLGEPFEALVQLSYPKGKQVLFPDSTFTFSTLTVLSKDFKTTISNDSTSLDQASYTFAAFELTSPQFVHVPVFLLTNNDTIEIKGDSIPIYIEEVIEVLPEQLEFKKNLTTFDLEKDINYPLYIILAVIALIAFVIVVLITFKPIIKAFRIKRLEKLHAQFVQSFTQDLNQLEKQPELAESVLSKWKNHLSRITKKPYHSYSTTEIFKLTNDEELKNDLRLFDQLIYSKSKSGATGQTREKLLSFAKKELDNRVNQLRKNGRNK